MTKQHFTDEQRALVRKMRMDGKSAPIIAQAVGRTEPSVRHLIRRMGMVGVGGHLSAVRRPLVPLAIPDETKAVRDADKAMRRALALAILRGDHLPAAQRLAA